MSHRVLHVEQPFDAGVPRVVAQLVRDQIARGYEVAVAAPRGGQLWDEIEGTGATSTVWDATRSPGPGLWSEVRALREILADTAPDLVHLHSAKAGLIGRLALRGQIPTVFQPHAWSFEAVGGTYRYLTERWERLASRWTNVVVCVSEAEAAIGKAAGIGGEFAVVPNGLDLDVWPPPTLEERSAARSELGFGGDERHVVCVGRLSQQKGQDVLLEAWARVDAAVPNARLHLVGDGPMRAELQEAAGPGIAFAGHRTDVRTWLVAADVVVIPSRWEGMSLAMLEAMACARPIVATVVAGAEEALGRGAGILVPPEDPHVLSDALIAVLSDLREHEEIGRRARTRIERTHDERVVAAKIAGLYERLLSAGS